MVVNKRLSTLSSHFALAADRAVSVQSTSIIGYYWLGRQKAHPNRRYGNVWMCIGKGLESARSALHERIDKRTEQPDQRPMYLRNRQVILPMHSTLRTVTAKLYSFSNCFISSVSDLLFGLIHSQLLNAKRFASVCRMVFACHSTFVRHFSANAFGCRINDANSQNCCMQKNV